VGARHQTIKDTSYDYDTGAQGGAYDASRVTPVAGIVFKPMPGVSLFANYIEGLIKGPTASGTGANGQPVTNTGEVFKPFNAKQKEVGAKYDGGRVGASLSFFTTNLPSAYIVGNSFQVAGEQRNRGAELAVFGEAARGVRLLGGLTYLDAKQKATLGGATDGRDAIGAPHTQANVGVEWDVPALRGFTVTARAVTTASQYADAANTQSVPSWTRFDLGARYVMTVADKLVTLRARVDNVADRNYWASAGGYPGSSYLTLGAPRTFNLSASVDF
jgi:iron complex outermembrane receptor protein